MFLVLLAATAVLSAVMKTTGPSSPTIIDFELAGSVAAASGIINAWDAVARMQAAFNLGIDYLYMPLYSTTIALACLWGAGVLSARVWNTAGVLLAWGLWLAALLDAVENVALTVMLFGSIVFPYPQIAQVCAICKFGLVILGLAYCALAVIARIVLPGHHARTA